jgi:hypothetical protein
MPRSLKLILGVFFSAVIFSSVLFLMPRTIFAGGTCIRQCDYDVDCSYVGGCGPSSCTGISYFCDKTKQPPACDPVINPEVWGVCTVTCFCPESCGGGSNCYWTPWGTCTNGYQARFCSCSSVYQIRQCVPDDGGGGYGLWLRLFVDLNENGLNDEDKPNCQWARQQSWASNYDWWNAWPAGWGGQYMMSLPIDNPNFRITNSILSSTKHNICSAGLNFPVNKGPITINLHNPNDSTTKNYPYPGDWSCSQSGACDCGPVWNVGISWSATAAEYPFIIKPKDGENWRIINILDCSGNGQPRCELEPDGTIHAYNLSNGASTAMDLLIHVNASPTPTPTPTPQPGAWWQVGDADVSTNGDLTSLIPTTCTLPACNPVFGLKGTGGFPGVPSYGGSVDFSLGTGSGIAAESPYSWSANSQSSFRKTYNYAFFENQMPTDIIPTEINRDADPSCVPGGGCTVNGGFFNSGGAASRGYVWYHFDGATLDTLTINGNVNLAGTRKVVLLIEGGDLHISGRINIGTPGSGFFMAVVGKNASGGKGNILIDKSVSHPNQPAVEGIYLAEGQIRTGTSGAGNDSKLYLRGSFAAYGGMVLERNLADDSQTPAEYIEYAPEIIATFPRVFTTRRMSWKEVAP